MTKIIETHRIKNLKFNGYKIELGTNRNGKPTAHLYRLLTSGKNKGTYKNVQGFYFITEEKRAAWIAKQIEAVKISVDKKQAQKTLKADTQKNLVNPYKVGDILYGSWGYDQTNIDFYQVTELKDKSVMLQGIGGLAVAGSYGHDSCKVTPDPTNLIGKPFLKKVCFYIHNNQTTYFVKDRFSVLHIYEKGEQGVYKSWGH